MSSKKTNNEIAETLLDLLEFPFDSALILRKKHEIKNELLLNSSWVPQKIALLGGSNTTEIKSILEIFLLKLGIKPEFYESKFARYFEEAVFNQDDLKKFNPDVIYIHTTYKNISVLPQIRNSVDEIEQLFQEECNKYQTLWTCLESFACPVIQNNFELPQQRLLGNLDAYSPYGAVHYINRLNAFFSAEAQRRTNLILNDINYLASSIGLSNWFDAQLWYLAHYALSFEAIPHLAHNVASIIGSLLGSSKKAIILDLDNTCWGGIIGDDGVKGIAIGKDTPLAEAFTDFQIYIKGLQQRGVILAVCSKNDLELAKSGFSHPATVLNEDDFALFVVNWQPKNANVLEIMSTLNFAEDGFIFIDDNPAERHLIRINFPKIKVPDIGSDVANYINYIDKNNYFETTSITEEDTQRTTYYKKRKAPVYNAVNYDEFLNSLAMHAEITSFSSAVTERVTQLINKTNQFNVTNKRVALNEMSDMIADENYITLYGRLNDCYGDSGLISAMIGRVEKGMCYIDVWVMSCRVFQRTMEQAMLDALVNQCKAVNITTIIGEFHASNKNSYVAQLYQTLGFNRVEGCKIPTWSLKVNEYKNLNKFIKVCS